MTLLKAKYGGKEIPVMITRLDRNLTPPFSPITKKIENVNAEDFLYTTYATKIIVMEFQISNSTARDLSDFRRKIAEILKSDEPKELIFSDEPELYYNAIISGEPILEEKDMYSTGTITWLIPDGLAHATAKKTYEAHRNNGVYELEIDNQGTVAAPIDFEITNNHENGYVGIVSEHGIIQIGRVDEKDEEQYKKSQLLLDHNFGTEHTSGWELNVATTVKVVSEHAQSGTGGIRDGYLYPTDYGTGANWHGPSWTHKIPADANGHVGAKNCTFSWHHYFSTGTINNLGVVQFLMTDKNKKNVAAVTYFKNAAGQNYGHVHMYINGKVYKEIDMECSYNNPITGRQAGMASISKYGERFEFSVGGKTYPFNAPEMKDIEVMEVSVYFGRWGTNEPIGANLVYSMSFTSHSVEAWMDVPNRYKAGTVIKVDGHSGKIYVDGVVSMRDEVKGTKYFLVPPGKTKIQFGYSDFSSPPPAFKAYIREAYL